MDEQNQQLIGVSEPAEYRQLIKVLARGKKGSRSLTLIESFQLVRGFYDKIGTVTQLSVAVMLMRVKGEVAAEVAGTALALRSTIDNQWQQLDVDIDWPCYGAKRDQLPYLLLSAKLLAENGYRILLHGDNRVLPHRQHIAHFIEALGIVSVSSAAEAQVALTSSGICYVNGDVFSSLVSSFTDIHQEMGLRSLFQSAIRCINPTNANLSLRSYFHPGLDETHIHVAKLMAEIEPTLGKTTVAIFKGYQGECELNPRSSASINVVKREGVSQLEIPTQLNALIGSKAQKEELQAQWLTELWHGEQRNGNGTGHSTESLRAYSAVLTNTAVLLMLTDSSLSIDRAKMLAAEYWMSRRTYSVSQDTHFLSDAKAVDSTLQHPCFVTHVEVSNAHIDPV
ncbi:glycosyl transferase [Shewanella abyssi]|uniref:glycosyl transferase n=1 Tax=Shewanella abyssi TaxID=311789 RepID=UPI00200F3637|nr:glycosyl transferase [Shewanella abyssi]MCL1049239.1 glycosyl transferase [Shewanella abyssi]